MELYPHIRILFGMVIGLAIAHLLRGLALIIQHPERYRVYWVHLLWVLFLFLYVIRFWWWEFNLTYVGEWTFPMYLFVALYAVVIYMLCVLILPDQISDYDGYRGYYYSRGKWFFALVALMFVIDMGDTLLKGTEYYSRHSLAYSARTAIFILLSLTAMRTKRPWFHALFAVFAIVYDAVYVLLMYRTIT